MVDWYVGSGVVTAFGFGVTWPDRLCPQHASDPSVRIAQVWRAPALTAVNVPVGAAPSRYSLSPQQAMVPSVRIAQLWKVPTLTAVNVPSGGVAWPRSSHPQQASVPSVRIAQA